MIKQGLWIYGVIIILALGVYFNKNLISFWEESTCQNKNISYVAKVEEYATFNSINFNLRIGPSTGHCVLKILGDVRGKGVTIIGKSGSWRQIKFNGMNYWIHGSLLN